MALGTLVFGLSLGLAAQTPPAPAKPRPRPAVSHAQIPPPSAATSTTKTEPPPTLTKQYCVGCHNDKAKTGGLTLASFDPARPEQNAEVAEKVIRKLRLGMMPPPGARRPDATAVNTFVTSLENKIDAAAALHPNPGRRTFQRLNRAEYHNAVQDLLDLDVDVDAFLPADTMSSGFDNIADVQGFSPTLMEGYLRAASRISALAVGDKNATASEATYKVPRTESQMRHVEGTPWGTRGGLSVTHIFPADGEYAFRVMLHGTPTGQLFGSVARRDEQLEVSINGERVALVDVNYKMSETDKNGLNLTTGPIFVKAGPQHVAAAFIQKFDGVVDDLMAPIDYTLADTEYGDNAGIYVLPHVRDFAIRGPLKVTGVSETPSRRRIFICRPLSPSDEIPCSRKIIENLASEAYRRPATGEDVESLTEFYADGRKGHDFESGIRLALQALLASPKFVFRLEAEPQTARPGQPFRLSDLDLASRLSFFLWGTAPDAELVKVARGNTLHVPAVLDKQVRRMLADPKAEAISTRFASQWLRLQDVEKLHPDALLFPAFDDELTKSYVKETQLFFDSIVREDRNVLDLLTADYSFVNERLARVYGIPNIVGGEFRRVTMPAARRGIGILGQGSVLMQTAVADRTSPVQRGKWIMEVLLGSPPPPPPPNVPAFDETSANQGGKPLSVRERMEEHRKNPMCASCHRVIDPIGLSLDNFDTIAAYRIKDNGVPVDTSGTLYDGTKIDGPQGLRDALLTHSEAVIRNFTDNLMSYALGRRLEYYDQPTIRAIVKKAAANGNRFSSFVLGIVNSPAFQMSTADAVTTTAAQ